MGHYTFYVLFEHDDDGDCLLDTANDQVDTLMADIGDENNWYRLLGVVASDGATQVVETHECEEIETILALQPEERFAAVVRLAANDITGYIQSSRYIADLRSEVERVRAEHEAITRKSFSMALWNLAGHLRRIEHGWQDAAVPPFCTSRPDAYAWYAYDVRGTDGPLTDIAAVALVDVHR